jgi:hypothetical protein
MSVRSLVVDISAVTSGLQSGVNSAVSLLSALGSAADRYGRNFDRAISSAMQSAGASVRTFAVSSNQSLSAFYSAQDTRNKAFAAGWGRLGDDITSVGKKLTLGLTLPLALLGGRAFQTYAQIDALKLGLENITGSAAGATARFTELREVSKLPGVGLEEAVQGDVRLRAVGFSAKLSKDALLQFGNALALTGQGKFELGNVLTQLTQMASSAKVLSTDLKPIIQSGGAIGKAVSEMFGSVSSEDISAKLQAAGRGPKQFIADLIAKLGELERVKSGPKNAIENLSDALKLAEYNFGAAADKAFGLTGIINSVGNAATSLADRFSTLSPAMQRVILTIGGVAIVAGPLLLAIGGIIAIIPSLITGWAAVSGVIGASLGPIALVGAAVVGAAYLIYTNWDKVKSVLTDSGIWQSVTGLVSSAMDTIRAVFGVGVGFLTEYWARFGGWITVAAKVTFQALAAVFNFGAGLLTGIMRVISGALTLDWRTALSGIVTIAKTVWNGVIDVFRLGAGVVGGIIAETLRTFGAETLASKLSAGLDKALSKVNNLKGRINPIEVAATAVTKVASRSATAIKQKPYDYSGIDLGGSGIEKAKDKLKALKDQIASGNLAGQDTSALQAEYNTLSAQIDKATASTKHHAAAVSGSLNPSLTANEQILKRLSYELRSQGEAASPGLRTQVALFAELVQDGKDLANLKPVSLGAIKQIGDGNTLQRASAALSDFLNPLQRLPGLMARVGEIKAYNTLGRFREEIEKLKASIANSSFDNLAIPQSTMDSLARYIGEVNRVDRSVANKVGLASIKADNDAGGDSPGVVAVQRMIEQVQKGKNAVNISVGELADAMRSGKQQLGQAGVDLLTSFGDSIGKGENPLKSVFKSLLNLIGDFAIKLGIALLFNSAVLLAAAPFSAGITLGPGLGQKIAGGLLIAGGAAVKAIPFAQGGTVSGPTYSMTGEYPGASRNPEFIAPASKGAGLIAEGLMKMGGFGGGGGNLTATVKGTDLEFVLERTRRSQKLTGNG